MNIFEKYQLLLIEYKKLSDENERLKNELKKADSASLTFHNSFSIANLEKSLTDVNMNSSNEEKVRLFMSLFAGRSDVYAKRWISKTGKSGYSPVCLNEWISNVCDKPNVKCSVCSNKAYEKLNEDIIEKHLRGNIIIGIYPMQHDETCNFLAIDFDDEGWRDDVSALRKVFHEYDIPSAVERSRSGNGAHIWFFFDNKISAAQARRFGTSILTYAMSKHYQIKFKSYDRLFPNQDTMPKGGFGNLISLPLQKAARKENNSVFVNENFEPYPDQWTYLSSIEKLSQITIETLIAKMCNGNELGLLKSDTDPKPWEQKKIKLSADDLPAEITIVKANMIFVPKAELSQRALNILKRLAAFKNPEFYKAQAMRLSTYNKPRIISCADETAEYLCLPRGCKNDIKNLLNQFKVKINFTDKTNSGRRINVDFNGKLTKEQQPAVNELMKYSTGVLSAATAFGKTVVAANLISRRKVNTLILVHRQQLLSQWKRKLSEFLIINEKIQPLEKKCGRKSDRDIIGQIGAGKNNPNGIIDVAVMQSLTNQGEVKEHVKNYGMVIVDECHHVPAFSFELILKNVNAKYVYGLTATPLRKDGHHPIIFMQCGQVRFSVDAKKQAEKRPFQHYITPRFTSFKIFADENEKDFSIQEIYSRMIDDERRNQLIYDDIVMCYRNGRNSLILTERVAHVDLLAERLYDEIPNIIVLKGGMGAKERRKISERLTDSTSDKPITIVATGKYIGEGFDESRLDTLFLTMPISWKGTLQQYAGRLHRLNNKKTDVQIFDYVDIHVRILEKMYNRRLNSYAAMGYEAKGESFAPKSNDFIFGKTNFLPVFSNDILSAKSSILIVSPFITQNRVSKMINILSAAVGSGVQIIVITKPIEDFSEIGTESNWKKSRFIPGLKNAFDYLKNEGIELKFRPKIHQKFAIIDQNIVWYGSINLLSFGNSEESIMRLESSNIAYELMKSVDYVLMDN